jgi:uncharacterized protein
MRNTNPNLFVNLTLRTIVCQHGVVADTPLARMRGLLKHQELPSGDGLLLQPAGSIHTAFMRFPIDVVFLNAEYEVIKLVADLSPWRTARASGAKAVLELTAGEIVRRRLAVGHILGVRELSVQPLLVAPLSAEWPALAI